MSVAISDSPALERRLQRIARRLRLNPFAPKHLVYHIVSIDHEECYSLRVKRLRRVNHDGSHPHGCYFCTERGTLAFQPTRGKRGGTLYLDTSLTESDLMCVTRDLGLAR